MKLPAVISGDEWQRIEGKKRAEKKEEERNKEERKRLREEKKLSKNGGKKKCPKVAAFDEEEDWRCNKCGMRFSSELIRSVRKRWVECDECKKQYH